MGRNYQKYLCWWLSLLRGMSSTLDMVNTGQGTGTSCCSHSDLGISRQHHVPDKSKDIKRAARKVFQGWECSVVLRKGLDLSLHLLAEGEAGDPVCVHTGRDKLFPME